MGTRPWYGTKTNSSVNATAIGNTTGYQSATCLVGLLVSSVKNSNLINNNLNIILNPTGAINISRNFAGKTTHSLSITTAVNRLSIQMSIAARTDKLLRVSLFTAAGKIVYAVNSILTKGALEIPTNTLSKGIYLLKITSNVELVYAGPVAITR